MEKDAFKRIVELITIYEKKQDDLIEEFSETLKPIQIISILINYCESISHCCAFHQREEVIFMLIDCCTKIVKSYAPSEEKGISKLKDILEDRIYENFN